MKIIKDKLKQWRGDYIYDQHPSYYKIKTIARFKCNNLDPTELVNVKHA